MRTLTLAAGAVLLAGSALALPVRPAQAQEQAAFITWQSPDDGARLSGQAVHIKARVADNAGVKSWEVEALAPDGADYPGYGTVCEKVEGGSRASVTIDCVWDTTAYPNDGGPARNRPYLLRITAQAGARSSMFSNGQPPSPRHSDRNVIVSNPVSAPRNVHLTWADATRQATVQWQPNPEPDVVSYVVQERVGDGSWKNVGQAGGKVTTFTRTLSAPGTYRYQVAALRAAGPDNETVQSAWAGPAAEPKQIVVAEPKRPEASTTTTQPETAGPSGPTSDPGDPTKPAPAPVTAAGEANGQPGPGTPAPGAPGATSGDLSRGAFVTSIQPGVPGSVQSGGATVGGKVTPVTAKPSAPAELDESEGPDTGYSSALPYKAQAGAEKEDGDSGKVLVGLPEAVSGNDARHLLVPLAAGLLLFVFAMHALYASRRSAADARALETD
ncbi:MAG TPA: hypothetical protein VHL53_23875 [Acidimicrobiia bacterium]|nr:hypothetical protein [Acidimicrobiia bacterium]